VLLAAPEKIIEASLQQHHDHPSTIDDSSVSGSSFTADDSWTYDAAGNRSA